MTKHEAVLWRRDKVQELLIKGYNQTRIAKELQVSTYAISNDVKQLNYQAKESMKEHLEHRLPLEFTHCIQGINEVLRMSFEIANSYSKDDNEDHGRILSTDENRTRLQASSLANDCYKYKMELMTNGAVVADALRYVEQKQRGLDKLKDSD
jgi:hypothetical protein